MHVHVITQSSQQGIGQQTFNRPVKLETTTVRASRCAEANVACLQVSWMMTGLLTQEPSGLLRTT